MFGFPAENIAFTPNCTTAINFAIKGILKPGDHIIISNLEHNAVARPVYALFKNGIIDYDIADFSFDKEQTINNFKNLLNLIQRQLFVRTLQMYLAVFFLLKR